MLKQLVDVGKDSGKLTPELLARMPKFTPKLLYTIVKPSSARTLDVNGESFSFDPNAAVDPENNITYGQPESLEDRLNAIAPPQQYLNTGQNADNASVFGISNQQSIAAPSGLLGITGGHDFMSEDDDYYDY